MKGALIELKDELPKLRERHRKVLNIFLDAGIDSIEDIDECVDYLADEKKEQNSLLPANTFLKSMDIALPNPTGLSYVQDMKTLGFINLTARNRYRDDNLNIAGCGEKVRKLIDDFFKSKKFWIYKKLAEKKLVEENLPQKEYVNGEGFVYLGKSYRLQLVDNGAPLKLSHGFFQLNKKSVAKGRETFINWYRSHALPILKERVKIYKDMIGVNP